VCERHYLVDGIQRIYDGGWDPSGESDNSKSEQAKQCMDLQHCLHWLSLGPHLPTALHWLHLEPAYLLHYTGCTWSPLTYCTTLAALGAHSPGILRLHLEPTHLVYYCYTWSPITSYTTATPGAHSPGILRLHLEPTHLVLRAVHDAHRAAHVCYRYLSVVTEDVERGEGEGGAAVARPE
jgi:hypothetical protein